jgi:hypothetical protein
MVEKYHVYSCYECEYDFVYDEKLEIEECENCCEPLEYLGFAKVRKMPW